MEKWKFSRLSPTTSSTPTGRPIYQEAFRSRVQARIIPKLFSSWQTSTSIASGSTQRWNTIHCTFLKTSEKSSISGLGKSLALPSKKATKRMPQHPRRRSKRLWVRLLQLRNQSVKLISQKRSLWRQWRTWLIWALRRTRSETLKRLLNYPSKT